MPYPYPPQTYTPTFYQPQYTPPTPPPAAQPSNNNNGLVWVQGETGAKSYLVAPNTTLLLMDSESQRFFLKSADASGMPMPLRIFEYKEVGAAESINPDKYVTREELDRRLAELSQKRPAKKAEVKEDEQ